MTEGAAVQRSCITMKPRLLTVFGLVLAGLGHAGEKDGFATFIELPWRYVIGGFANGQWLNSEAAGKHLTGAKTDYRVFTPTAERSGITGGKASPDADVCPDVWLQTIKPTLDPDERNHAVGVCASWNPMPRKVRAMDTTLEAYVKAMSDVLASKGIAKAKVKITQLLRVDLDGDGKEEVLTTAIHYTKSDELMTAKSGDYSLITLRRLDGDKVKTLIVNGEVYPKGDENAAPNTYEVAAVLDLDGDGTLEILIRTAYYEGGGMEVYKLRKGVLEQVLRIDCGV
jgi:hypothetical protein